MEAQGGHGSGASGVNTTLPLLPKNHQPVGGEHHSHTSGQERGGRCQSLQLSAQPHELPLPARRGGRTRPFGVQPRRTRRQQGSLWHRGEGWGPLGVGGCVIKEPKSESSRLEP